MSSFCNTCINNGLSNSFHKCKVLAFMAIAFDSQRSPLENIISELSMSHAGQYWEGRGSLLLIGSDLDQKESLV